MNLNAKGKKLFGTVNESTELKEKYDSSLLKVFYIRGHTGRLYHTDAMPKVFAKRETQIRGEVYSESEMAQQRIEGKIRMVGPSKETSINMISKS